jgi:hypothetical protein
VTVPSRRFATHTDPNPTATAAGPFPTTDGAPTTAFVCGLTWCTDGPVSSATHTTPPEAATADGEPGTAIVPETSPVAGSIRVIRPSLGLATQTAPSPNVTAPGVRSRAIAPTTWPVAGSIRPMEFGGTLPIAVEPPLSSSGRATAAATTATAIPVATRRWRPTNPRPRFPVSVESWRLAASTAAALRSAAIGSSRGGAGRSVEATAITRTGSEIPFMVTSPWSA